MSEENVKTVRKAYANFNRGDFDAFMELCDDDMVVRTAEGWPERALHGKLAVRSFFEGLAEVVGHDAVIEDLVTAGNCVVLRVHAHLTGEWSGIEGDMELSHVLTLRKGKFVLAEYFWDHQDALEAAGLRE
jgi:ketosteroid isomerase-like protein